MNYYVLFQYVLCLVGTSLFLFNQTKFALAEKAFIAVLISIVVVNCGVLFENRPWVRFAEWARIIAYPALLIVLTLVNQWSSLWILVAVVYMVVSVTWFYLLTRSHAVAH